MGLSTANAAIRRLITCGLLWLALVSPALAHPAQFTRLLFTVNADGSFKATVNLDVLAFTLDQTSCTVTDAALHALLDGPRSELTAQLADANAAFRREVVVRTETDTLALPDAGWVQPQLATFEESLAHHSNSLRIVVLGEITFAGRLPAGARTLAVRLPYVLGETIHVYELPGGRTESAPVAAGEYGPKIALSATAPPAPQGGVFGRYIGLGFIHIVPQGLDHILFVLGLFLLSARLRPLLWQVSAFTLAHTLTLALSLYGVVSLPASMVEPLIAASIVFIAVENLCTDRLYVWRPFVVFGFGLLHGLGFAAVLSELGLPPTARLPALLGFNLGVECGQLAVIALAFLAVGWFRRQTWYRSRIVIPLSVSIAVVALLWTVQRLLPPTGYGGLKTASVSQGS